MDIVLFCKMCKEDKKHMDLDWQPGDSPVRFKCFSCGEYNSPPPGNIRVFGELGASAVAIDMSVKNQSIAEEIMEPLEIILKKLVKLSNETQEIPVNSQRVYDIAAEMDAALSFVRRELESFYPDEDEEEEVCGNCGGKGSVAVPDGEDEIAYEPCPCSDTREEF